MIKNAIRGTIIHLAGWFCGYYLTIALASYSESKVVYSVICAWWLALYVDRIANVGWLSALMGLLAAFLIQLLLLLSRIDFFWQMDSTLSPMFAALLLFRSLLVVSPIMLNALVSTAERRYSRAKPN